MSIKVNLKNEKALVLFHDALEINKSIDNKVQIGRSLNNVADLQLILDQKKQGLGKLQQSLSFK